MMPKQKKKEKRKVLIVNNPDFNDAPVLLQTYNRSVIFQNLYEDAGRAAAEDYAASFSMPERKAIAAMIIYRKKVGTKEAIARVTKGVSFDDYYNQFA